ncbi:hypothetical protein CLOM_g17997 [Closterium sp. NIES-68]|nr:hypothetical protein CLOM_g17997 [Closterium sp. NIES-68]GJP70122.1 hypothetical protein CLOP_g1104 [Closterium sp. NIES-67]
MFRYNLDEVITRQELRSRIADEFRRHQDVENPKVIDLLVFKGREELVNYLSQSKQRHHVISQWVVGPQGQVPTIPGGAHHKPGIVPKGGESQFLRSFYESN